ncbi:MAG: hypothetical protein KDB65_06245 [Calditrichaeota bacterium]|nr:hypothetical protein [Calditrichota bacterium]MCB9367820.1 hypothetical protein [Calditrichota bacterium]
MAILTRFLLVLWISSLAFAVETDLAERDSLLSDTTLSIQLDDSSASRSHSPAVNWLLPLTVIGATAGVFIILFTARSK